MTSFFEVLTNKSQSSVFDSIFFSNVWKTLSKNDPFSFFSHALLECGAITEIN